MRYRAFPNPRIVSGGYLALLSAILIVIHATHLDADANLIPLLLGVVFPMLLAVGLGVAAVVLWQSDLDADGSLIVAAYSLFGGLFASLIETGAIAYRYIRVGDWDFLTQLGHEWYILITFATIGALAGWLIGWNNAHRRREHKRLLQTNRTYRDQTKQLEELASILSHDLRNPLAVAKGRLEILENEVESKHIAVIDRALDRIENIISESLLLARQNREIGDRTRVDLESQATQAWQMVETEDVSLKLEGSTTLRADPNRLREAFENLFRNALDHGGDDISTIWVGVTDGMFYVEDDGVGIPESKRESVFDMGMTTEPTGTGIGLAVIKRIVSAHNWTIEATEGRTGGARFEIRFQD